MQNLLRTAPASAHLGRQPGQTPPSCTSCIRGGTPGENMGGGTPRNFFGNSCTSELPPRSANPPGSTRCAVEGGTPSENFSAPPAPGRSATAGVRIPRTPQGAGIGADLWGRPPPSGSPYPLNGTPQPHLLHQSGNWLPPPPPPPLGRGGGGGGGGATGRVALSLLDTTLQAFAAALQGMVMASVVSELPYPTPAAPGGRVAHLSLLHLQFACGVGGDSDLPPI